MAQCQVFKNMNRLVLLGFSFCLCVFQQQAIASSQLLTQHLSQQLFEDGSGETREADIFARGYTTAYTSNVFDVLNDFLSAYDCGETQLYIPSHVIMTAKTTESSERQLLSDIDFESELGEGSQAFFLTRLCVRVQFSKIADHTIPFCEFSTALCDPEEVQKNPFLLSTSDLRQFYQEGERQNTEAEGNNSTPWKYKVVWTYMFGSGQGE